MASRAGASSLVLVAMTLLAGCLHPGNGDVSTASTNTTPTSNATCFEGSCDRVAAFQETNKTVMTGTDSVDHTHDYWQGRERVTMFTTSAMMTPIGTPNAAGYKAAADFRPPQGTFVYEGTDHVEFTIFDPARHACEGEFTFGGYFVCSDNLNNQSSSAPNVPAAADPTGGSSGLKLRYKHASASDWIDAGDLAWGKPTMIQIKHPTETDMPHATSSAWEFQVVSPNEYDATLTFKAKADIIRGPGSIPLWPPHPDFYADSPTRVVLQTAAVACDTNTCKLPGYEKAGPVSAQRLISYGTRTLVVFVNITDYTATVPATAPNNWYLWHWNSTGNDNVTNVFDKTNHPVDKKENVWILPVDDNGMDSPYADGSKWKFMLGGSLDPGSPVPSCYSGCGDWGAKYTITILATNQVLPFEKYDWACLRNDYCPKANGTSQDAPTPTPTPTPRPSPASGSALPDYALPQAAPTSRQP